MWGVMPWIGLLCFMVASIIGCYCTRSYRMIGIVLMLVGICGMVMYILVLTTIPIPYHY